MTVPDRLRPIIVDRPQARIAAPARITATAARVRQGLPEPDGTIPP